MLFVGRFRRGAQLVVDIAFVFLVTIATIERLFAGRSSFAVVAALAAGFRKHIDVVHGFIFVVMVRLAALCAGGIAGHGFHRLLPFASAAAPTAPAATPTAATSAFSVFVGVLRLDAAWAAGSNIAVVARLILPVVG
jgi:hypothetical protein